MSCASVSTTCIRDARGGNMISGAAQGAKKRRSTMRKTDAMHHAERHNGKILDELWRNCGGSAKGVTARKKGNVSRTPSLLSPNDSANHTFPSPSERASPNILLELSDDGAERSSRFLRLNVGGSPFLLLIDSILRADQSGLLAKFIQLEHTARMKVADGYLDREKAYYFQRSPAAFEPIFQYYSTGVIHRPPDLCYFSLSTEMEFWRIPTHFIASCCSDDMSFPVKREESEGDKMDNPSFEKLCCGKLRRRMWQFLERPGSSLQAKAFELSSTLFVAISVLGLSFGTIPDLQVVERIPTGLEETIQHPNGSITTREKFIDARVEHPIFIFTERVCIAFFTVEYALRLFAAPYKLRFALKPLNVVDLLAIVPFYLELILTLFGVDDRKLRDLRWAFLVVRILRVLRVIRIIKLGRFSSGLQTFGMTLKRSQKQLQMMTIVLLTGVVFFSTMIYFLEKDDPGTPFTSIPAAYWWCVVTMTTVGYGDIVPATTLGKIIASAAIMSGVLVLALPITIIVDNFIKVAQEDQQAEQLRLDGLDDDDDDVGGGYVHHRTPPSLMCRDNRNDRRTSAACVAAIVV